MGEPGESKFLALELGEMLGKEAGVTWSKL